MKLKRTLICGALTIGVITGNSLFSFAQNITYEVKPNDMFWKISQKYGISTLELMKANNATENTILYPGQILTIPLGNQTVHTVKSGETYWTISKKYGVDFQKVLSANNATENSILYVGDTVLIPSTNQKYGSTTYTVQKGETYWTISKKFNVDFNELLKLNGANDKSYLDIGQVIKIPSNGTTSVTSSQSNTTYKDYTVQKGDTLWIISDKGK
jgi:D-gamma-glutamyl-meso-diaminopimelic acid endopeptidase CwlS